MMSKSIWAQIEMKYSEITSRLDKLSLSINTAEKRETKEIQNQFEESDEDLHPIR